MKPESFVRKHIDKIVNKILTARKMPPQKIMALAKVIQALAYVKEREDAPNEIKDEEEAKMEALLSPPIQNLSEIEKIEIDGQEYPVRIASN